MVQQCCRLCLGGVQFESQMDHEILRLIGLLLVFLMLMSVSFHIFSNSSISVILPMLKASLNSYKFVNWLGQFHSQFWFQAACPNVLAIFLDTFILNLSFRQHSQMSQPFSWTVSFSISISGSTPKFPSDLFEQFQPSFFPYGKQVCVTI